MPPVLILLFLEQYYDVDRLERIIRFSVMAKSMAVHRIVDLP